MQKSDENSKLKFNRPGVIFEPRWEMNGGQNTLDKALWGLTQIKMGPSVSITYNLCGTLLYLMTHNL